MGQFLGMANTDRHLLMRRMAESALSQVMGAKRKFGRSFGLGNDDDFAFGCMLIIAYLVSLRRSLARVRKDFLFLLENPNKGNNLSLKEI